LATWLMWLGKVVDCLFWLLTYPIIRLSDYPIIRLSDYPPIIRLSNYPNIDSHKARHGEMTGLVV